MNIILLRKSKILPYIKIEESFYKNEKRNQEYILGRFLAKFGAKILYKAKDLEIVEDKKPKFKDIDIVFSISHSKDFIAVAFDKKNIGVDIEIMRNRDFKSIAEHLKIPFTIKKSFYQYWTTYEAQYKSKKQNIKTFIIEDYMLSVSFEDINNKLKMYEVTIPKNITEDSELINLKLVIDSNKNDNALELQEINTASFESLQPLALKIE